MFELSVLAIAVSHTPASGRNDFSMCFRNSDYHPIIILFLNGFDIRTSWTSSKWAIFYNKFVNKTGEMMNWFCLLGRIEARALSGNSRIENESIT